MITAPGIYDMPIDEYVNDPAPAPSLNTSTAVALLTQSPFHARLQHPRLNADLKKDGSSRADLGSIAHALLLENDSSKIVVIEADDWRTKATKEQRDAARAEGKLPILEKDHHAVMGRVKVATDFMMGSELCADWFSAKAEQTLVWQDASGVWCRARPDKLTPDYKIDFDYKASASAHPGQFVKTMISQGYDIQFALRRMGIEALTGVQSTIVFLVQEIEYPYVCSLVSPSPMFCGIAKERVMIAIEKWRRCLSENDWRGYPDRLATVDPPNWYGLEDEL